MENADPESCVLCDQPAVAAPRIHLRQERELARPVEHCLRLCASHGTEWREGRLPPQQIIYTWAIREHDAISRNERLVIVPELRCLGCDAPLADTAGPAAAAEIACARCGAQNTIGTALGYPVAVGSIPGVAPPPIAPPIVRGGRAAMTRRRVSPA